MSRALVISSKDTGRHSPSTRGRLVLYSKMCKYYPSPSFRIPTSVFPRFFARPRRTICEQTRNREESAQLPTKCCRGAAFAKSATVSLDFETGELCYHAMLFKVKCNCIGRCFEICEYGRCVGNVKRVKIIYTNVCLVCQGASKWNEKLNVSFLREIGSTNNTLLCVSWI